MKFLSIEIEHVFAYDNRAIVDLSGTTDDRNIILVWGRNGSGKTSFLNALKLLFTGVEHPSSRMVGFLLGLLCRANLWSATVRVGVA